jgi:cell division protein FtsQ
VGNVEVRGNKLLTSEEIYQVANIDARINIFKINGSQVRKRLLQDLRIQEVKVSRKFPATIILDIKERQTVAFVPTNYGFVQVDEQGYVLAALRSIKLMGLPMITGTKQINPKVGDKVDMTLHPVFELLGQLDEETLNSLSEINVANLEAIVIYTVDAIPIKLGDVGRPAEKAQMLNNVLKDVRRQKLVVEYIDIAYGTPVLKFKR